MAEGGETSKLSPFIGNIECFVPGDDFSEYVERLNNLFVLNNLSEDRKVPFLISVIGSATYRILKNLTAPTLPKDKKYDEAIKILTDYFKPTPNKRAERMKFHRRNQKSSESIADYIVELKAMADSCVFGDFLDDALCDRLIGGLLNTKLQMKLINQEKDLKFEDAKTIALNYELTDSQVKGMNKSFSELNTNFVRDNRSRSKSRSTWRHRDRSNSNSSKFNNNNSSFNKENVRCYKCNLRGHYARFCKNNSNNNRGSSDKYSNSNNQNHGKVNNFQVNKINSCQLDNSALNRKIKIENKVIEMEIDTGACATLMEFNQFKINFPNIKLKPSSKNLRVVTGQNIIVVGVADVKVQLNQEGDIILLELIVIETDQQFTPLLGRSWLDHLVKNWRYLFSGSSIIGMNECENVNKIDKSLKFKEKFPEVFTKNFLEPIDGFSATIHIKPESKPIFHKAYTVPFGIRDAVDKELDRLVKDKILVPVRHSDWASPMVVATKSDGSVRICIDCKATINRYVVTEHYPLPNVDDILAGLGGFQKFSVLDLAGAYQQLVVEENSREYLTINTQKGLFRYTRLAFGVSSAPSIFQEVMDKILRGIDGVFCYLDDILIGGRDERDCEEKLTEVMNRLRKFKVKVNSDKCKFFEDKLKFLGFYISGQGVEPDTVKVEAIVNAPEPKDVTQLRAFLGLINYYGRFIKDLSSLLHPLYRLLGKDVEFKWESDCKESFEKCKKLMAGDNILVHYNPNLPLYLICDASLYGVGAILAHLMERVERPVYYGSSTLSPAEKNYSVTQKEALAIMFGLKKFHKYLYGKHFIIVSDHQPLREIFNSRKGISAVAASRIQRWAVTLSMYNYEMEYRKGEKIPHADALSRLPIESKTGIEEDYVNSFNFRSDYPLDQSEVSKETMKDCILGKVLDFEKTGWPKNTNVLDVSLKYWNSKRGSISCENNCLFYGDRLIIPKVLREKVLDLLHRDHIGMVRMKMLARSLVWWEKIEAEIECFVRGCEVCALTQTPKKEVIINKWPESVFPYDRVHIDFFYFNQLVFLLIVDSYSKWVDVIQMSKTHAYAVIEKLRINFAIYGMPKTLVSDNGPPFDSKTFLQFCEANGIKNTLKSPAYHPQSNGQAERFVESVKDKLKKSFIDNRNRGLPFQALLDNFLINFRNTPCTVTGKKPSELLFKYAPRTLIDILKENNFKKEEESYDNSKNKETELKENIKTDKDSNDEKDSIEFCKDQKVLYKLHFKDILKWVPAIVIRKLNRVRYLIDLNGMTRVVHQNHLRVNDIKRRNVWFYPTVEKYYYHDDSSVINTEVPRVIQNPKVVQNQEVDLRRSSRIRKVPVRLNL